MIPVDNFYNVLYANLFNQSSDSRFIYFLNFTTNVTTSDLFLSWQPTPGVNSLAHDNITIFYDQEPIFDDTVMQLLDSVMTNDEWLVHSGQLILGNSEHSNLKTALCKNSRLNDWYYFYHGFAALDWYRDYKYFPKSKFKFDKVFMSLNHLMTTDRSYRLTLVANYIENGIMDQGIVSLPLKDKNRSVKEELFAQDSKMSVAAKKLVHKHVLPLSAPLIADTEYPDGYMSAATDFDFQRKAFWHVVAETVFYHKKLHLTEKIFKPIIARRPFLLVAAPGNLAYLKTYGFKTFYKWVDESYDNEQDDDKRIAMLVEQLKKLCALNKDDLYNMQQEMDDILDYNFNHFYGKFKHIIVSEMLENFQKLPIDRDYIDFGEVYNRFMR
jgi:hypothetical protein